MQNELDYVKDQSIRPIYSEFQSKCKNCGGVVIQETTVGIMKTGTFKCPFCACDLYIDPKTLFRNE